MNNANLKDGILMPHLHKALSLCATNDDHPTDKYQRKKDFKNRQQ